MGNPISEPHNEDVHVHFVPESVQNIPEIVITEPELQFEMESESESETTSDTESIDSLEFADWINNHYRYEFLKIFKRVPACVRNAVGTHRVLELFDELTSTIRRENAICSPDMTAQIIDLLLEFEDEDRSLLCDRQDAIVWMKVILNQTTNFLLISEHDMLKEQYTYNIDLRSVTYRQLTHLAFSSTLRAYRVSPANAVSMIQLMEYRAGINELTRRSIICYRLIMMSGQRGVPSLAESRFVTKMSWFRDHSCFIAVGAVRSGHVTPIPNLPFGHSPFTHHRPVEQNGPEELAAIAGGFQEQGVYDYFLETLKRGASAVGGAAASGATEGVMNEIFKNPALAFGAKMANAIGSSLQVALGFLVKLWDLFPIFTPLLGIFAAWRFTETASLSWALFAVGCAIAGGYTAARWFTVNIWPVIVKKVRSIFKVRTRDANVGTLIDNAVLDDDNDDLSVFELISFLFSNREPQSDPELFAEDPFDFSERIVTATPRDINKVKEQAGEQLLSADILASVASAALLGSGIFMKDSNGLVAIFAKYTGVVNGMKGIISLFVALAAYVINNGSANIAFSSLPLNGRDVQIADYLDALQETFDLNARGMIPKTQTYVDRISKIIEDGQKILAHAAGSTLNGILTAKLRELEKIRTSLVTAVGRTGLTRMEPLCVGLWGAPGTFKTATLLALGKAIVSLLLHRDKMTEAVEVFKIDQGTFIFTKPAGEHWDGANELTLVYIDDDFGQEKPGNSQGSPGTEFTHLNNTIRYNPKMAGLDLKNTAQIRHKLTLISTNMKRYHDKTMEDPGAVTRRMELNYRPVLDDKNVMNEGFDPMKIMFQPVAFDGNRVIQDLDLPQISFYELVVIVYNEILRKERFFNISERLVDGIVDDIVKRVPDADPMEAARDEIRRLTKAMAMRQQAGEWVTREDGKRRLKALVEIFHGITLDDDQTETMYSKFAMDNPGLLRTECYSRNESNLQLWNVITSEFFARAYLPTAPSVKVEETKSLGHLFKGWLTPIGTAFNNVKEYVREHGPSLFTGNVLAGVLAGVATASGLYTWWNYFMRGTEQVYMKETKTKAERKNASRSARARAMKVGFLPKSDPQAANNVMDMVNLVEGNRFKFSYQRASKESVATRHLGYAVGIMDTVFVVPWHFWVNIVDSVESYPNLTTTIFLEANGQKHAISIDDMLPLSVPETENDRFMFRVTKKSFPAVRSILKHIAWEREIFNSMTAYAAGLAGVLVSEGVKIERPLYRTPVIQVDLDRDDPEDDGKRTNMISYVINSVNGDCGTPLILSSGQAQGKFCGFHTHGNGVVGHSTAVSREWVHACLGMSSIAEEYVNRPEYVEMSTAPPLPDLRLDFHPPGCAIVAQGVSPPSLVFQKNDNIPWHPNGESELPKEHTFGASDIHPSRFTDNRARFTPREIVNAEYEQCKPAIAQAIADKIIRCAPFKGVLPRLSFEQAIDGDLDLQLDALKTSKATGYPYSSFGINRLQYWSRSATGQTIPGPRYRELAMQVAHLEMCGKIGSPLPVVWQIFQKAEKLKLAKIQAGKTRDVNCAPLAFLVLCRMYLGAGMSVILRGAPENECLLTTDPQNAEQWNTLAKELMLPSDGECCEAGDFEGFDHSHSEMTLDMPAEVFRLLYKGAPVDESRVREAIFDCVKRPQLIFGSTIEVRTGSMPSGFLGTTPFNCIINMANFRFCWMKLHGLKRESLLRFDENVICKFCGDDNIYSVTKAYNTRFHPQYIASVLKEIGYKYTSADKTAPKDHNSHLTNHTMVKRGFRFEKALGKWVGPLDLDRVIETCMWTKAGQQANIIGADNCDTVVGELSLHGKEVFDHWVPKIQRHAAGFWSPKSTDWETVLIAVAKESSWEHE